jgi:hypothetical protein
MATQVSPASALATGVERAGAEVLNASCDAAGIKLFCRIRNKRFWCDVLEYVLARRQGWEAHVCQQYFISQGRLKFGWNVIVSAQDLEEAARSVRDLFIAGVEVMSQLGAEQAAGPLQSFPLQGFSPNRNRPLVRDPKTGLPLHRGAYSIEAPKE